MKLAIGDVVRDRSDHMLCTVAGVATNTEGLHVALAVSGGGVRLALPSDIDLVARGTVPMTTGHSLAAMAVLVLASLASAYGVLAAQELGADWALMFIAGLGAFTAVSSAYRVWLRLTGPRRFRV